jgi:hypothetical protein
LVSASEEGTVAFRTFIDSAGHEWQVYDVVPRDDERRHYDRRSTEEQAAPERRNSDDRRLTVGRVSHLTAATSDGWLTFERGGERRRLSPIPANWTRCPEPQLEKYCESARPVRPTPIGTEPVSGPGPET